jgi:hypothetical protein
MPPTLRVRTTIKGLPQRVGALEALIRVLGKTTEKDVVKLRADFLLSNFGNANGFPVDMVRNDGQGVVSFENVPPGYQPVAHTREAVDVGSMVDRFTQGLLR